MLEVTLSLEEARYAMPVVRTDLSESERLRLLERVLPRRSVDDRASVLVEIAEDRDNRWRATWLQARALYEVARDSQSLPHVDTRSTDPVLMETLAWAAGRGGAFQKC
jgi:hypothetical protein